MLPTGIFLNNTDADELSAMHPGWRFDMECFGPWKSTGESAQSTQAVSPVIVTASCESTMAMAMKMTTAGELGEWGAVLSATQTLGRGQLRRPWVSMPGNLHASIVLPDNPGQGAWAKALGGLLPLVAGYLVSVVLTGLGAKVELKWPNDILQNGRKVGGLLIEERNGKSVLGLGLNLVDCPGDEQMREDRSVKAGVLRSDSQGGGPLTILEALVSRGKNVYAVMLDEIPPNRFLCAVERRLSWMGRTIRVREGEHISYEAVIAGLSPKGGLILHRDGEETVLYSGSIFPL